MERALEHVDDHVGGDLDDRPAVSYPDACQGPDGRVYAVHDRDRGGVGEVLLSIFEEDDIPRD